MSRRLDISSLLCDDPPPDRPRSLDAQVVAEPVVLAPHLVRNRYDQPKLHYHQQPQQQQSAEHALDTLARAAALAEKQRSEPPFVRRDPQISRSPVQDPHPMRAAAQYPPMQPPPHHILEQQRQQQLHMRMLQQQQAQQQRQQQQQFQHQQLQQQENLRLREHHEQMMHHQQDRLQAQWGDRDTRPRAHDIMGLPMDLRPGRKSDPGQVRPLTSPASHHLSAHIPHQQPMEPPNKRRRYSDSPGPLPNALPIEWERASSLKHTGERSILNPEPPSTRPELHRPSSSSSTSSHSAAPFAFPPPPRVAESVLDRSSFPPGRRSPPGSVAGRARARKSDFDEPDVIPVYAAERKNHLTPSTTVIHLPERERDDYEDKRPKKSHPSQPSVTSPPVERQSVAGSNRRPEPQQQDSRQHGPPQRRPQPPPPPPSTRQPKEEDAHEWLLEHYADPSSEKRKPEPRPLSPTAYKKPSPVHTTKRVASPLVPATEAAIALEEELESVHVRSAKDDEMDVDIAVSNLVEETLQTPTKQEESIMEVDVEDELLSLVDDRPRSRSSTRAPSISRVPSGGSKPTPLRLQSDSGSRQASPMAASSPSAFPLPPSERGSMPPPASTVKSKESASRKKEAGTKAPPKPKAAGAAAKPRAKPAPKPKAKATPSDGATGPVTAKAKPSAISRKSGSVAASVSASRSRSTSAMPGGSVGPDGSSVQPEDDEEEAVVVPAEDDKLYCICKTKYDEDRFMIACDRCDEWYHTQCVDMPDLVVDLVDQFFCPLCIEKHPNLSLKTTYKQRCRYGLDHPDPNSPKACHKPAQGAFSKYCSPECGLNNMKKRIDTFAKNGGKKELLWDSVKDAQKREAVVIIHEDEPGEDDACTKENGDVVHPAPVPRVKPPTMGKVEREVANLNAVLDEIVTQREDLKEGMEIVVWRERLLELANDRAEQVGQCGWDQRLCFGDDEWAEFGAGVLESYDDGNMHVDGEDWWCVESEKCGRHAGWQVIRSKDVAKEKEKKEEALDRLTTREREIRKRIEDIVEPYNRSRCLDPSSAPLKSSKLVNGNPKVKPTNGDSKKGKKRKNPA
ncbi:hypothetical protein R3P38DRAFT_29481 [Favolaschia claudopus]|uniref:PHD-type domain-containing protein n=1 Tax=Favolaschia claudopus TaxID=2862362 RepID=A0AAW0EIJ3_9AGAR